MQLPLQISFRNMESSEAVASIIRAKAKKLDTFAPRIMGCRVVVQPAGRHHLHGNPYEVRIDLTLPGGEIAVTGAPGPHAGARDIAVAIRDAFGAARRQLEDFVHHQRGEVKAHAGVPRARICRLFPKEGFGFLQTAEGREVYFHRHSVLEDGFDALRVGTEVAFAEEEGRQGPQASTVKVVGRPAPLQENHGPEGG